MPALTNEQINTVTRRLNNPDSAPARELVELELRFNGSAFVMYLIDDKTIPCAMMGLRRKGLNQSLLPDAYSKTSQDVHISRQAR